MSILMNHEAFLDINLLPVLELEEAISRHFMTFEANAAGYFLHIDKLCRKNLNGLLHYIKTTKNQFAIDHGDLEEKRKKECS